MCTKGFFFDRQVKEYINSTLQKKQLHRLYTKNEKRQSEKSKGHKEKKPLHKDPKQLVISIRIKQSPSTFYFIFLITEEPSMAKPLGLSPWGPKPRGVNGPATTSTG